MLTKIIIKNLAIIKDVEIDFKNGLNIITGETGAGKSILIDALTLLSGGRASVEVIREGEGTCEVQGIFDTSDISKEIKEYLSENDIDIDDELIIRRVLQRNGKSRAYINSIIVTQGYLESLGQKLVSVLSQHETQCLFQPVFQLELFPERTIRPLYLKPYTMPEMLPHTEKILCQVVLICWYLSFQNAGTMNRK
ncbi:MAG: AAA family ATPase [Proteobacteria bacterium]|nr:AAA family ATPase [Pseudomonadota bacterium]